MATGIVAPLTTWTAGRRKRDGKRFYFIPGSKPGLVYMTSVDGCTCPAAQNSRTGDCKHQAEVRRVMAPAPIRPVRARFEDLFPECKTDGCRDISETHDGFCDRCASDREFEQRLAARRAAR